MNISRRISADRSTVRIGGLVALGLSLAIAASVTIAGASGHRRIDRGHRQHGSTPAQLTSALREAAKNPGAAVARALADRGFGTQVTRQRAGRRRSVRPRPLRTRVYAAEIDWPYAYSTVLKYAISMGDDLSFPSAPNSLTLVRRNLLTGEQTALLKMRRAMPLALRAGAGRVIVSLLDIVSTRGNDHLTSRVIEFDAGTTTPRVLGLDNLSSVDDDLLGSRLCGRIAVLTGVADTGEALVARLTGNCTTDGQSSYSVETVALAPDGTSRVLDTRPPLDALLYGRTTLSGDRLLRFGPSATTVSQLNTTTGTEERLWRGFVSTYTASQASDGSVAVSGGPGPTYFADEFGSKNSAGDGLPPMVVFPQGDADQPSVVEAANSTSVATQYCGERLYELQLARRQTGFDFDVFGLLLSQMNGGLHANTRLKVIVRDRAGGAPRLLATTRKTWVRAIGCDGDTLLLATAPRLRLHVARYGP